MRYREQSYLIGRALHWDRSGHELNPVQATGIYFFHAVFFSHDNGGYESCLYIFLRSKI